MSERRPFHREQPRYWWAHKPYLAYTIRELCGFGVAVYGAILLAGLFCLWRGPDAFGAYQRALASPLSLLVHLTLLGVMIWHVVTWFQTMPKTMPRLIRGGQHVPQERITAYGLLFAFVCSALLLVVVAAIGGQS